MIDAEVMRLRELRHTALQARALAVVLNPEPSRHSVYARSALSCWQLARVISGRLRGHPYLNYQRGPTSLSLVSGGLRAALQGAAARYAKSGLAKLSDELRNVARELDDARALTWSADLSDTFGRSQDHIRRLIAELDAAQRKETGSAGARGTAAPWAARSGLAARPDGRSVVLPEGANSLAGDWPYLAF